MAIKNITLTGAEITVTGLNGSNAAIRNDGTDAIYAAKQPGITPGTDGVLSIPAGSSAMLYNISGKVYALGTGAATIISSDFSGNPLKSAAQSGSGADDVARAAINEHADNAGIHVTADGKAVWNAKAELSDIPTSLPANGGNADTLDGKHASDFMADTNAHLTNCNSAKSFGVYSVLSGAANSPVASFAMLIVFTASAGSWVFQLLIPVGKNSNKFYFRKNINNGGWEKWLDITDGFKEKTPKKHPAAKFVLKSEYDALAARVAALEGKA